MQVEDRVVGDVVIVKVNGDITLKKGIDGLMHQIVKKLLLQGHTKLLFDLGDVAYVDSSGLGELIRAHSAAKNGGGSLRLFSLTKRLEEMLVLTSLTSLFQRFDNEAQALASFGQASR
jgi:anti-sigma B factor antagonist